MHAGLIYLRLQTADKIFQRKISFQNEALQFVDGSQFPLVQNILFFLEFCCISLGFFGHSTSVAILPAINHYYIKLL
jgi:hypothetical protein